MFMTVSEISEEIYQFLESIRGNQAENAAHPFLYTLRRSNLNKRLDERLWFHGTQKYIVLSFWLGTDWKNKTPNIIFSIYGDGRTYLTFTSKDSSAKSLFFQRYLVSQLGATSDGTDQWTKAYSHDGYLESLQWFIENDKLLIDSILKEQIKSFSFEDNTNRIDFISKGQFEKWHNNILKYREKQGVRILNYSLDSFRIQHYTPINDASFGNIPANTQFIFLVGDNGCGKSSLLKSMSILLGNRHFENDYLSPSNSPWLIDAIARLAGTRKSIKINQFEPKDRKLARVPFAAYGPSRLMVHKSDIRKKENELGRDRTHALWSIFYPDGLLIDFNRWIQNEQSRVNNHKSKLMMSDIELRYDNIKQLLVELIPGIYDIRNIPFEGSPYKDVFYFEEDLYGVRKELPLRFEQLSSGIRSLVAMLGDMMVRLFEQQPEKIDPSELEGFVIIDEIDLHLHPKWQKKLPALLANKFPAVQFIVSTHSPIPLLGVPENSAIYHLARDPETGVKVKSLNYIDVKNLLPNTILTSAIFGMDSLGSIQNTNPEDINVDDDMGDTDFFNLLDKKLEEIEQKEELFNKKYFNNA